MKRTENDIAVLSRRLQVDLLALNGKLPQPALRLRPRQMLLLAVGIVGVAVLLSLAPRMRTRLLWEIALLAVAGSERLILPRRP